jgi:hypothetical protein
MGSEHSSRTKIVEVWVVPPSNSDTNGVADENAG